MVQTIKLRIHVSERQTYLKIFCYLLKEWTNSAAGKQSGYHAAAEFYQSQVAKESKDFGEEIARLRVNEFYAILSAGSRIF